ncbi:MAG TPA: hypothetical protein VM261_22550 [Kofleriaceae bacterium]|nr:hypothetical protein [Kofleriaceae bacterium]
MLRASIKAAIIVGLGALLAWGVLRLVTDLDWPALTPTEQLVVVAVIVVPLLAIAAVVLLRAWLLRGRAAYFADLGFEADVAGVHRDVGGWIAAHAGSFETPDGVRRPAWLVQAQAKHPGKALVVQLAGAPTADYVNELAPVSLALPAGLAAWGKDGSSELLDEAALAELGAVGDIIQLRVTPVLVRLVLERATPPANVRRALVLVAKVAGLRLPATAATPPSPAPGALERGIPSYYIAIGAAVAYVAAIIGVGALAPDREGYEDFIMARTRRCGLAREALGEPIERVQFGWQPSTKANRRQASHLLVRGSKASGDVRVEAYARTRGTDPRAYPIIDAIMDAPGGPIEILACSRSWKAGITAPRTWRARERGAATATCTVRVEPSPKSGFQECRLEVECGPRHLFGKTPDLGFADCWTVRDRNRDDVVVSDPDRGLPRPEPTVELDERTGIVQIGASRVLELEP